MTTIKGSKSKCKQLLVVAIDFGTTYSGYAFSFRSQYNEKPTTITANTVWTSGGRNLVSLKTPTVLLLHWEETRQEFTVKDFGYNAENKYEELVMDGEHKDDYLVRNFKMELYNKTSSSGLTRDSVLSVGQGKTIRLAQLYSMAIHFLKKHLMDTLKLRDYQAGTNDIHWVLTVPAIWTDAGKQIMMDAATEVGIKLEKLTLVLEPEAASLFCLHMPSPTGGFMLSEGSKYIVVDAGGGTVDINVHEVKQERTLLELHAACGGPWGGTMVDDAFTSMITDIVGKEVFTKFSEDYREDLLELYRDIEVKKGNFDPSKRRESLRVPPSLGNTYITVKQEDMSKAFTRSKYKDEVKLKQDKILINTSVIKSLFRDSCDSIVKQIKDILAGKANGSIDTIVLVGGYGESHILQEAIKTAFKNLKMIVPEEASLVVLKGAVIYGHNPGAVLSRVAQRTYGVDTTVEFEEGVHPENKKEIHDGDALCVDRFDIHIKKGQDLKLRECHQSIRYYPAEQTQTTIQFDVYGSTEMNPKFVTDESCTKLGHVHLPVPDVAAGLPRSVDVTFQFDTQIKVTCTAVATKEETVVFIDFLSPDGN